MVKNWNGFKLLALTSWLALGAPGALQGQEAYSTSTLLQPLDSAGGSARAMAMGSAFVAVADDSSALLWNPAGLGQLRAGQLAFHHNFWLVNTLQESLIFGIPAEDVGGFAAMASYLDYGAFQGRDNTGALTSSFSANKTGFMMGWGKEWVPGLSLGFAVRGSLQSVLGNSYGLLSGDAGLLYSPNPQLRLGAALVNFGGNQAGGLVASTVRVGISFKSQLEGPHSLLLALDGDVEPQGVNRVEIGMEYSLEAKYFLRGGFQLSQQDDQIEGLRGFTTGAGIRFGDLILDYAYLPYGDLGTSHRISLSYQFSMSSGVREKPPATISPPAREPSPGASPVVFKPNPGKGPNKNTLTLQFDVPPDLVAQGQALEAQGKRVEAMRLYRQALQQNGQDAAAWSALGTAYSKMGQRAYAIQCFEEALKLQPGNSALADWLEKYKAGKP